MRKLLLAAALSVLMPAGANAATWIAACYDGKNVQYNQTIGGKGFLYLQMGNGDYQGVPLIQDSADAKIVCSVVDDHPPPGGTHYLKVCADITQNTISLTYKDPTGKEPPIDGSTPYCKAAVTVH